MPITKVETGEIITDFESSGRLWCRKTLDEEGLTALESAWDLKAQPGARLGDKAALAPLLAPGSRLGDLVAQVLPGAFPVRLVAFDKTSENNWALPWHQDRVIALRERHTLPGYDNWTRKAGTWHCEPPLALLQGMLFARLHLDDCDEENGALEIALGSHRLGPVPAAEAAAQASACPREVCRAKRGDVLLLKMLTLHRSSRSKSRQPRRSYRIDFAAEALAPPLAWCR